MKRIPLYLYGDVVTHTLVDDHLYDHLNQWRWHLARPEDRPQRNGRTPHRQHELHGYARRGIRWEGSSIPTRKGVLMHSYLTQPDPGYVADHIDGDPLNNQLHNLRVITSGENNQNARKRRNASSRYRGVSLDQQRGLWMAQCTVYGQHHYLGRFADEEEAAEVVKAFRLEHMPYATS